MKNRTITTAYNRWIEMVEERESMRQLVTRALGKITRQVESAGFRTWVRVWRFQRKMDNSDYRYVFTGSSSFSHASYFFYFFDIKDDDDTIQQQLT